MIEVFPENFSFVAQFSLNLWLFEVLEIVRKFQKNLQFFFIFRDYYIQTAFAASLTGAIS